MSRSFRRHARPYVGGPGRAQTRFPPAPIAFRPVTVPAVHITVPPATLTGRRSTPEGMHVMAEANGTVANSDPDALVKEIERTRDRKSTRLNSSPLGISY